MKSALPVYRILIVAVSSILAWQLLVWGTGVPRYILPSPVAVAKVFVTSWDLLLPHLGTTALEIVLGLLLGVVGGAAAAIAMMQVATLRIWLMPWLVISQAVPVFAIAPVLVLWLGYGFASKVAMATLIIFFPVTSAFVDGLKNTPKDWIELGTSMSQPSDFTQAKVNHQRFVILRHIQIPAALPAFASGVRVATAVAPIGAVVGEWVGSSSGLGYLMLHSIGRVQIDLVFAALSLLALFSICLWYGIDRLLRYALPWIPAHLNQRS